MIFLAVLLPQSQHTCDTRCLPGQPGHQDEALGGTAIWEQLTRAEPRVELYLDCKSTTGNKKITVNQSYKLMA